jgi:hypothetical protein
VSALYRFTDRRWCKAQLFPDLDTVSYPPLTGNPLRDIGSLRLAVAAKKAEGIVDVLPFSDYSHHDDTETCCRNHSNSLRLFAMPTRTALR